MKAGTYERYGSLVAFAQRAWDRKYCWCSECGEILHVRKALLHDGTVTNHSEYLATRYIKLQEASRVEKPWRSCPFNRRGNDKPRLHQSWNRWSGDKARAMWRLVNQGYDYTTIGRQLGVSKNAICSKVHRDRRKRELTRGSSLA